MKTFISDFSGKEFPFSERVPGRALRQSILKYIQAEKPEFSSENNLSVSELNPFRERYISDILRQEVGELSEMEEKVLSSIKAQSTLTDKLDGDDLSDLTLGQRVADKVASFGGSWTFIISFGVFLLLWISTNVFWLANRAFDPFPFILLNLILSCIAALQAPVIMMSQNRQEEKDRDRARKDYMINLKSELEIRTLHEKIDHLIMHQQQELLEIQKVQVEMMDDLLRKLDLNKDGD